MKTVGATVLGRLWALKWAWQTVFGSINRYWGDIHAGSSFRKDDADLNSIMIWMNKAFTFDWLTYVLQKYTCANELYFARFCLRVSMAVRCPFSLTLQLGIEYNLGISSVTLEYRVQKGKDIRSVGKTASSGPCLSSIASHNRPSWRRIRWLMSYTAHPLLLPFQLRIFHGLLL